MRWFFGKMDLEKILPEMTKTIDCMYETMFVLARRK